MQGSSSIYSSLLKLAIKNYLRKNTCASYHSEVGKQKRKLTRYLHVLGTAEACKDIGRLTERGELGARKNVLTLSPDSQDQAVSLPITSSTISQIKVLP